MLDLATACQAAIGQLSAASNFDEAPRAAVARLDELDRQLDGRQQLLSGAE
jgi:hypothetical protein